MDGALRSLASLQPAIMDQGVLEEQLDNPWADASEIPANIRNQAASKHNAFKADFERYASRGSAYRAMLRELASTISVFRNNLQHGEKAPLRPRDVLVAEVMVPVLQELVDLVLDYPSRKLATYGLLTDPAKFSELTELTPRRYDARLTGRIEERNGLRYFVSGADDAQAPVVVSIAESPSLPLTYERLDAFEGSGYKRVLVPAYSPQGIPSVCNVYEANRRARP